MAMKHTVTVTAFRPLRRGTLCGFAVVYIRELLLVISDLTIHRSAGGVPWVQLPAKPLLDRDGNPRRTSDGKVTYAKVLNFDSRAVSDAFSDATIEALFAFAPEVFNEPAA